MPQAQYFNLPVTEVISRRSSIRTYNPVQLPDGVLEKLNAYTREIRGPFSCPVRFVFLEVSSFAEKTGKKIGTYGFIRGAQHFIAGIVEKGEKDLEELGYVFEQLILYATSLGLGTCWLGGTFRRKSLLETVALKETEMLPAITPIGYAVRKEKILNKGRPGTLSREKRPVKRSSGPGPSTGRQRNPKRKPWAELFFHQRLDRPLAKNEAGDFHVPLEMVRLAPSASNRQPWRVIKSGDSWHFYLEPSLLTNKILGFEIQRIDMGIALCHFELTARELGLPGNWDVLKENPPSLGTKKLQYVASWRLSP